MKVAVIGAGAWGKNLVRNLHGLGALAAVAEPNPALRNSLARDYPGLPLHEDWRPLLSSPIPAVAVATPAPTHYEVARAALLAGKDAFVEKPLALSVADAEDLAALARARGRVLMAGHLLLYQPAIQWMKERIAAGAIGAVRSLHQERLNLGTARSVENALWSLGVHDVAVLLWLVGAAPSSVAATGQCALRAGVEDDVYLHLEFPGGVRAHLHCSWLWPEKRRRLTVIGETGMIVYDEAAGEAVLHRKRVGADLKNVDAGREEPSLPQGEPLRAELEHFLARLADRKPALSSGESAVDVVRVLAEADACLAAARRS